MTVSIANSCLIRLPALCNATLLPRLQWPAIRRVNHRRQTPGGSSGQCHECSGSHFPSPTAPASACSIFLDIDPWCICAEANMHARFIHLCSYHYQPQPSESLTPQVHPHAQQQPWPLPSRAPFVPSSLQPTATSLSSSTDSSTPDRRRRLPLPSARPSLTVDPELRHLDTEEDEVS